MSVFVQHLQLVADDLVVLDSADADGNASMADASSHPPLAVEPADGYLVGDSDDDIADVYDGDDEVQIIKIVKESKRASEVQVVGSRGSGSSNTLNAIKSKTGYVKEWIDEDGLGMIFSMESGPVLFNIRDVWIEGVRDKRGDDGRVLLSVGSNVEFIEMLTKSSHYKVVSKDEVMRQAVVVWIGTRPPKVWRFSHNKSHLEDLKFDRTDFVERLLTDKFVKMDLVRCRGKIAGYLDGKTGFIRLDDAGDGRPVFAFFSTADTYLFRNWADLRENEAFQVVPVGLSVRFDAREITFSVFPQVKYQAVAVFCDRWPATPHPTLFPTGETSYAPTYEVPKGHAFYYLKSTLPSYLRRQRDALSDAFHKLRHGRRFLRLESIFLEPEFEIRCQQDYFEWKEAFAPEGYSSSPRGRRLQPMKLYHTFSTEVPKPVLPKPYRRVIKDEFYPRVKHEVKPERAKWENRH